MRDYKYDSSMPDYKYALHKGLVIKFLKRNVKRWIRENIQKSRIRF